MKGFREGFSLGRRGGERPGGGARDSEPRPAEVLVNVDDWELMIITCLMTPRGDPLASSSSSSSRRTLRPRRRQSGWAPRGWARSRRRGPSRRLRGSRGGPVVGARWSPRRRRPRASRVGPRAGLGAGRRAAGVTPPARRSRGRIPPPPPPPPPRGSLRARARRDRARRGDGLGGDGHVPAKPARRSPRTPSSSPRSRAAGPFRLRRRRGATLDEARRDDGLVLLGRFRSRRSRPLVDRHVPPRSRSSATRRACPRRSGRAGRRAPAGALGVRSRLRPAWRFSAARGRGEVGILGKPSAPRRTTRRC